MSPVNLKLPMCMQLTFLNFNMLIFFLICNINLNTTNVIQCDRNVGKLIIIILVFAKQFVVNKGVVFCVDRLQNGTHFSSIRSPVRGPVL